MQPQMVVSIAKVVALLLLVPSLIHAYRSLNRNVRIEEQINAYFESAAIAASRHIESGWQDEAQASALPTHTGTT